LIDLTNSYATIFLSIIAVKRPLQDHIGYSWTKTTIKMPRK